MNTRNHLFILSLLVLTQAACSSGEIKRNSYEALQNIKKQRCYQEQGEECDTRQNYHDYQNERENNR
ncbi:hypothetical protein ACFL2V_19800 [Pseudomonadota bacterium]